MNTQIIGICGRRYTGKTYLAQQILSRFDRVMVYDVRKEDKFDGFVQVFVPGNLPLVCKAPKFNIAYRPADVKSEMDYFCQMARWSGRTHGDLVVLFDECHRFMSPNNCPEVLVSLAAESRHDNLTLIFISQQLDTLNNKLFNEFTDLFVFQLINIDDIKFLQKYSTDDVSGIRSYPQRKFFYLKL